MAEQKGLELSQIIGLDRLILLRCSIPGYPRPTLFYDPALPLDYFRIK
jgi:hypothetical protein